MPGSTGSRRRGASLRPTPARVLILTTFDLDEYVYEALRIGASGFVLKDDPAEQLIAAVRTVAAGDALLSPVDHQARDQAVRAHPTPRAAAGGSTSSTARELEIFRLIAADSPTQRSPQELLHQRDQQYAE